MLPPAEGNHKDEMIHRYTYHIVTAPKIVHDHHYEFLALLWIPVSFTCFDLVSAAILYICLF